MQRRDLTRPARVAFTVQDLWVQGMVRTAYASTATLSGGSALVTFTAVGGAVLSDRNYVIVLSGNANETFYWTSKTTTGFTIVSSNPSSSASVDWKVEFAA